MDDIILPFVFIVLIGAPVILVFCLSPLPHLISAKVKKIFEYLVELNKKHPELNIHHQSQFDDRIGMLGDVTRDRCKIYDSHHKRI